MLYPLSYGSGTSARSSALGSAHKSPLSLRREQSPMLQLRSREYADDKEIFVLTYAEKILGRQPTRGN